MLVHLGETKVLSVGAILNNLIFLLIFNTDVDILIVLFGKVNNLFEDVSPLLEEALLGLTLLYDAEGLLLTSADGHFLFNLHLELLTEVLFCLKSIITF